MEVREPALVGRQRELEQVAEALSDDRCRGVALRGGAGVGKTRLAEECLATARELGYRTRTVLATESTRMVPLGAMAALVPPLGAEVNPLGAALDAVRREAELGDRLLLFVDDAQWLDDTSAALLYQAVAEQVAFLVMTIRDGESLPAATTALLRGRSITQIRLGPLCDADTAQMATDLLGGDVDPELVDAVVRLGNGSPLHVHELTVGAVESGAIVRNPDGRWAVTDGLERSHRVADLVADRMNRLEPGVRTALTLVALAEPLPQAWIPPERHDDVLQLLASGLLTDGRGDERTVRVAHPLYGEVLRNGLGSLERQALLDEVITAARSGPPADDAGNLRLMMWSVDSGLAVDAIELRRASRRAFATNRFDLAARLLDAVPVDQRDPDHRYDLMCARFYIDDRDGADELLTAMLTDPDDERELARAVEQQVLHLQVRGDRAAAHAAARSGLDRLTDAGYRERIEMVDLSLSILDMRAAEVVETLLPVLDAADDPTRVAASVALVGSLCTVGRPQQALEVATRCHEVHRRLWVEHTADLLPAPPTTSLLFQCLALAFCGYPDAAGRLLEESAPSTAVLESRSVAGDLALAAAAVAHRAGRLRDTFREAERAVALYDETIHRHRPRWQMAAGYAAVAAGQLGRDDLASRARDRLASGHNLPSLTHMITVCRAWADVASGQVRHAVATLAETASSAMAAGDLHPALEAAWSLVRLDAAANIPEGVESLADRIEGELLRGWFEGVAAARAGDAEALDRLGSTFESHGLWADAADAHAAAARRWAVSGAARRATASARAARLAAEHCQGLRTPGLLLPDAVAPLTAREREVAALAADGTPAKEIAERLFISQRTVTNHLQRVYEKLGVSSRSELREALDRR